MEMAHMLHIDIKYENKNESIISFCFPFRGRNQFTLHSCCLPCNFYSLVRCIHREENLMGACKTCIEITTRLRISIWFRFQWQMEIFFFVLRCLMIAYEPEMSNIVMTFRMYFLFILTCDGEVEGKKRWIEKLKIERWIRFNHEIWKKKKWEVRSIQGEWTSRKYCIVENYSSYLDV